MANWPTEYVANVNESGSVLVPFANMPTLANVKYDAALSQGRIYVTADGKLASKGTPAYVYCPHVAARSSGGATCNEATRNACKLANVKGTGWAGESVDMATLTARANAHLATLGANPSLLAIGGKGKPKASVQRAPKGSVTDGKVYASKAQRARANNAARNNANVAAIVASVEDATD